MSRSLRTDPELYELTTTNSKTLLPDRSEISLDKEQTKDRNYLTRTTTKLRIQQTTIYQGNNIPTERTISTKTWTIAIAASVSEEYSLDLYHAEQYEPSQFTREYTQLYSTG